MTDEDRDAALARLLAATAPPADDAGLLVARAMARIRRPPAPWWRRIDWVTPWRMSLAGLAVAGVLLGLWLPLPAPNTPPAADTLLTLLAGDTPGLPL